MDVQTYNKVKKIGIDFLAKMLYSGRVIMKENALNILGGII